MSDVRQALAELRGLTECRCETAFTSRGRHASDCVAEYRADVETLASALRLPPDPVVDIAEVVSGRFFVRDQRVNENGAGAWMVHLPTGIGVAHAEHRSLLQNRAACIDSLGVMLTEPEPCPGCGHPRSGNPDLLCERCEMLEWD